MKGFLARVTTPTLLALLLTVFGIASLAQPAQAQSEVTEQDVAMHYSLYWEDFRNQNYRVALPNLMWILEHAPGFPQNNDRNYRRLVELYTGLAEQAEDGEMQRAYMDSALVTFDRAVPALQAAGIEVDEVQWLIRKGRFIQENQPILEDRLADVPRIYMDVYEIAGCDVDPYYARVVIDDVVRQGDRQATLDLLEEVEACYPDDADMRSLIADLRNNLFRSPEERMTFLEEQLARNPEDVEMATELFDIYMRLGHRDMAFALGERLAEMERTARTLRLLATMALEDGNPQQAFALFEEALTLPDSEDPQVQRDIYFNMGIAQQELGSFPRARTYYRNALQADPNYGPAYMAIGDLYVYAISNCGTFEREDRAVYWLAVDYYERARSADPSVASQANQRIATYRRTFPDAEALFFRGWQPGQSYRVDYGCYAWINETTTVRSP